MSIVSILCFREHFSGSVKLKKIGKGTASVALTRNPIARNLWKFNKPKVVKSKKLYCRKGNKNAYKSCDNQS